MLGLGPVEFNSQVRQRALRSIGLAEAEHRQQSMAEFGARVEQEKRALLDRLWPAELDITRSRAGKIIDQKVEGLARQNVMRRMQLEAQYLKLTTMGLRQGALALTPRTGITLTFTFTFTLTFTFAPGGAQAGDRGRDGLFPPGAAAEAAGARGGRQAGSTAGTAAGKPSLPLLTPTHALPLLTPTHPRPLRRTPLPPRSLLTWTRGPWRT